MNEVPAKQATKRHKKHNDTSFKPGESGNPNGRPKKGLAVAEMISAKVTDEDWELILAKAVEQAKEGDKAARDFLTNRKDGLPIATQHITTHEPDEVVEIV